MPSFEDSFGGVAVSDDLSHKGVLYFVSREVSSRKIWLKRRRAQTVEQIGQVAAALDVGAPGASGTGMPQAPGRSGLTCSVHTRSLST